MIKRFLKQRFCFHDYREVETNKLVGRLEIVYRCSKCGKEYYGYIREY